MRRVVADEAIDSAIGECCQQREAVLPAANRRIDLGQTAEGLVDVRVEQQMVRGHLTGQVGAPGAPSIDALQPIDRADVSDVPRAA